MGVHLRKKLRLFAVAFIHSRRAEVDSRGFKRLGILFLFLFAAVLFTNWLVQYIAPWLPFMEHPLAVSMLTIFIVAALLLILLRKTKSGRDIVLGR